MEKITSRKNPCAVHMKKLGSSRAYREESGEFLCDGIKLLEDAINSGAEITAVLTASHISFPVALDTRVYHADQMLIDYISPLKNAQDTLFACKFPPTKNDGYSEFQTSSSELSTQILLDGMQDPGNVGAIIRTANAFGINCVILTGGCADPYNPKAIRASMGAVFRQRIHSMSLSELTELKIGGVRFTGAALQEGCRNILDVNLGGAIVAIGSEGRGLSEELLALCDEKITIPIAPECESLNAAIAAAIIIWQAR